MESLNKRISIIKQKFPEQSKKIEELFEEDEDFRTLCSDYFLCVQYLKKVREEFDDKQSSIGEYESIRSELEKELYSFLFNRGEENP